MAGITLTQSVRQNLLALQSTSELLAQTQNRLSTGKKVNSALDNPTNFFTAQSLDARAGDISNLLDGIGNGVNVLKAADTGITSLQKLVDTAKSIANQALQSTSIASTKASTTTDPALLAAGEVATATDLTDGGTNGFDGLTLIFETPATATPITLNISDAGGTDDINSIAALNSRLAAEGINLTASLDAAAGTIKFSTNSNSASQTIIDTAGPVAGEISVSGTAAAGATIVAPVFDPVAQAARDNLVTRFNDVISQISTTAQDSSFNGVNLLNGDSLDLVFNETGTSNLTVTGVTLDAAGLGLGNLATGLTGSFADNSGTNAVLDSLNTASNQLRSQSATFGANLSIVQLRQDFSKQLINVLKDGAASLTLADLNEEAAISAAATTRRDVGTLALSNATQAEQGILRLLQ